MEFCDFRPFVNQTHSGSVLLKRLATFSDYSFLFHYPLNHILSKVSQICGCYFFDIPLALVCFVTIAQNVLTIRL